MNNEQSKPVDVVEQVDVNEIDSDEQLTVEVASEIRAGTANRSVCTCKNQLA